MSEITWVTKRVLLYSYWKEDPRERPEELAKLVKASISWVKKWLKRFKENLSNDPKVFFGLSRARKTPTKKVMKEVEQAIIDIREAPPDNLRRLPGPRTILYYLHRDETLKKSGLYLPKSTRTIWQILDKHQKIYRPSKPKPRPEDPVEPMEEWQLDFKSISSVPPEEGGKKQHVVETLNIVDKGTSILVETVAREDFRAETSLITLVDIFTKHGLPDVLNFDRDPRFVGSWNQKEFPSALMRFLYTLGIRPQVCPPHRPDKNAFVERFHRSLDEECLAKELPNSLVKTTEVTQTYKAHYNYERPHQGRSCQNQPPRVAFPEAKTTRCLPQVVDPDRWLKQISHCIYSRRVNKNGSIQIGNQRYYVGKTLAKQEVLLRINAEEKQFLVCQSQQVIKKIPIKGLFNGEMSLADYVDCMIKEAMSEARRLDVRRRQKRRLRQST